MSRRLRGLPPGRAGRMWLTRRLAVATRGADLLEQKLRILLAEEQDFSLQAERTQEAWVQAVAELDRWLLRSALLSGERGLRLATGDAPAVVDIEWRMTMGARYPASVECTVPEPAAAFGPDNTALRHSVTAAEETVRAGAEHAVATTALAAVQSEIASTRRQLRALRDRWVPRLEAAHAQLMITLDDQEHDEQVRLRWAAAPTRTGRRP
jgi:V/A-type H+/Na+-transporting ATPase subunit D